jgi:hypothetical protein
MKKALILAIMVLFIVSTPAFATWSIVSSKVSEYNDSYGAHAVVRITVTIDGSAGSFTTEDVAASVRKYINGYLYWIGIDGIDTGVAPQITITDPWNFTRFADATSFHATNPVGVAGNSYNGQYPQIFDGTTFTFTDSGNNGQKFYLYLDMVR